VNVLGMGRGSGEGLISMDGRLGWEEEGEAR
jgi:hypothetical protein